MYSSHIPGFKALAEGTSNKVWNCFVSLHPVVFLGSCAMSGITLQQYVMISEYLDLRMKEEEEVEEEEEYVGQKRSRRA